MVYPVNIAPGLGRRERDIILHMGSVAEYETLVGLVFRQFLMAFLAVSASHCLKESLHGQLKPRAACKPLLKFLPPTFICFPSFRL